MEDILYKSVSVQQNCSLPTSQDESVDIFYKSTNSVPVIIAEWNERQVMAMKKKSCPLLS